MQDSSKTILDNWICNIPLPLQLVYEAMEVVTFAIDSSSLANVETICKLGIISQIINPYTKLFSKGHKIIMTDGWFGGITLVT
jgi:hypothetical protein